MSSSYLPGAGHDRRVGDRPDGTDAPDDDRSVLDVVVRRTRAVDVVLLGLVPAVLVGVFLLPPSVVDAWRLAILHPTWKEAFLSHFVHGSPSHLVANLAGYVILAPLAYVLCLSAGRRREFLVAFATFLLALPFALSWLDVVLVRPSIGYGFSGIDMALLGLVALAVGWHVEARFDAPLDDSHAPLVFFVGAAVIAANAVPPSPLRSAALGLAAVAGVVYVRSAVVAAGGLGHLVSRRDALVPGRVELTLAGLLVVALFPLAAFPPNPAHAGVILNVYEHALGYCFGFVAPYVTVLLLDRTGYALG